MRHNRAESVSCQHGHVVRKSLTTYSRRRTRHRSGLRARTAGRGPGVNLIAFHEGANDGGTGRVLREEKFMPLVARVRADYFPRWRSASKWTVRFANRRAI